MKMSFEPDKNPASRSGPAKVIAFYGAYCVFGLVGLASSMACLPFAFFRGQQAQYLGQKLIHHLFAFFTGYLRVFGLAEVDGEELARLRDCRGVIFVANHPSLLDVVIVIAQMPRMFCLMKSSLVKNSVLSGQSRLAGYVDSRSSFGLIKSCRKRLRGGGNFLIFPEGTRSRQTQPCPFKMGFAVIAKASQAPVQTLIITISQNFLGKGWPFFKRPMLPFRCSIRLGERFVPGENEDARRFGQKVEAYYQRILQQGTPRTDDQCAASFEGDFKS